MPIVDPFDTPDTSARIVDPFDTDQKKPDDHGLAERQKMSLLQKAINPVTGGYWQAQKELSGEAWDMMKSAFTTPRQPGDLPGVVPAMKLGLGALGYVTSPAYAALRSIASQPIEDVTGIPREYTEFAASMLTPGLEGEAAIPGFAKTLRTPNEVAEAAQRAGIDLPRAITTTSPTVRAGSQALGLTPIVGTPLREAVQAVPKKIGAGVEEVAGEYGKKLPENIVGGGIESTLSARAEAEAAAAQARDAAAQQAWEQANEARERAINTRQAQAEQQAQATFGHVDPIEMGEDAINQVQAAEGQARRAKEAAYDQVNALNARVSKNAFNDVLPTAETALKDAGYTIDAESNPNATKMMAELDRLTGEPAVIPPNIPPRMMAGLKTAYGDNIPPSAFKSVGFSGAKAAVEPDFGLMGRHAPEPGSPSVPIQGVEQLRRRIGDMAFDAQTDADRAASGIIKNAFDDWYHNATANHLTADSDPNALATIQAARQANADWRTRFGYNAMNFPAGGERRNAARILNRMVTGDAGPEEVARQLIGATPGTRPVSAPLYEALSNAVANPVALRNNVRGAYFGRIAGEGRAPTRVASDINNFLPTRMGAHLLDDNEQALLRGYGETVQRTPQALKDAALEAKATKPVPTAGEPGKAQEIAKTVLGRNRSDEQVFNTVDKLARSDIKGFARTWGAMTPTSRSEFRGALLRNLGGTGDDFNAGNFVKNWDAYSPQAKAAMFSREHRQALDDFRTIAKQYGDNIKKYGNPSGTAQVTAWQKLAGTALKAASSLPSALAVSGYAALYHPGILMAGLGLRKLSKILAQPEGAQQVMRWNRLSQAYSRAPNARTLAALSATTRDLDAQRE